MKNIELLKDGKTGLKGRLLKTNAFQHHTGYQINVFPFKTQPGGHVFKSDFVSFQGIMGETIRLSQQKELDNPKHSESSKTELKHIILENALQQVETTEKDQLKDILSKIYFEQDNGLFKYDFHVISYMNFINDKAAIKDIPVFIADVFIKQHKGFETLLANKTSDNILNQLISDSLPKQTDKKASKRDKQVFRDMMPEVTRLFQEDFDFLLANKDYFLEHFELFFQYYYFFYFTQLSLKLDLFGKKAYHTQPVNFSMDWENLSESRLSLHTMGWKKLSEHYERVFAHANALELINYIVVDNEVIGDYDEITALYNNLQTSEQQAFKDCLQELLAFYKEEVDTLIAPASWEACEKSLQTALDLRPFDEEITTLIYSLWYVIRYQFENGKRNKPYKDYASWLVSFSKENFTKSGGRLGAKLVLSQEVLLFLTKLCVGSEEKIRLKLFWERLRERGITLDETSKLEIIKLFERINLIEKKSDSGDAQYIKSSL